MRTDADRSALAHAFGTGRISPPHRFITAGTSDRIPVVDVIGSVDARPTAAVVKTAAQGGPQERFAYELAGMLGIDHLLPVVGLREDGSAIIEFRQGATFHASSIMSGADLERALQIHHATNGVGRVVHGQSLGIIDRQLIQVFDHLLLNADRHYFNGLHDAAMGVTLLDHANIGEGSQGLVTRAFGYVGGTDTILDSSGVTTIQISDEVRERLATLDHEQVRTAFHRMQDASMRSGGRALNPEFAEGMLRRAVAATDSGSIRVVATMPARTLEILRRLRL